jgi:hypothetical protein
MSKLYYEISNSLTHHGIKGQKWGIRRFQNKDGTLTAKGKKRYDHDSSKPKSKHRIMLEENYKAEGKSQREAEIAAAKRIKTEKIIAATAGVTVAAGTAYIAHKKLRHKTDAIIKAGSSLQRVEANGDGVLHDVFYAANKRSDKAKYVGLYGGFRKAQTGKAFLMDIGVEGDIKVAGQDKATDVFKRLCKTDAKFNADVHKFANRNLTDGNVANGDIKKLYENFNAHLVNRNSGLASSTKKFYNALKSEGYGAVRDVNDIKFSGYKAANPLILFDAKNNVSVKTIRELTDSEIHKNKVKAGADLVGRYMGTIGSASLTFSATKMYSNDVKKYIRRRRSLKKKKEV